MAVAQFERSAAVAYSQAHDLAVSAALEAEPLSTIMARVLVALLGTIPPSACDPSQIRAIRLGVSDAIAGRPCRTPDLKHGDDD
jgi:hypothetical protein